MSTWRSNQLGYLPLLRSYYTGLGLGCKSRPYRARIGARWGLVFARRHTRRHSLRHRGEGAARILLQAAPIG